jgi:hypothetical protein
MEAPRETVNPVPLAIEVSKKTHGFYRVIPNQNGTIDKPVTVMEKGDKWRYVSRKEDKSFIPKEADRQIGALQDAGTLILQVLVGHNLTEEAEKEEKIKRRKENIKRSKQTLKGMAVGLVGMIALGIAVLAQVLTFAITTPLLFVDPRIVVVLEDGTWLCVVDYDS